MTCALSCEFTRLEEKFSIIFLIALIIKFSIIFLITLTIEGCHPKHDFALD